MKQSPIPVPTMPPGYPKKVHIHGSTPERETSPVLPAQPTPPRVLTEHRHAPSAVIPESQDIDSAADDSFVGIDDRPRTRDRAFVSESGSGPGSSVSQSIDVDAGEEEGDRTIPESEEDSEIL